MDHAVVLTELAQQVRGHTLQILTATKAEWLTWSPPGTSNHILWHAGHAAWVLDLLGVELLSGRSELPQGWAETFGEGSDPKAVTEWPSLDELQSLLQKQLERFQKLLEETPDDVFLESPKSLGSERNSLGWIIHGLHDEAKHGGEMHLLRKLCLSRERAGASQEID